MIVTEARKLIKMAKDNIKEVQGYMRQRNRYSENTIRTFNDAMKCDKELIESMNELIKTKQ